MAPFNFNTGITGNRLHAETRLTHYILTNHGLFSVVRDYLHPSMFQNPMCKAIFDQFYAAFDLYNADASIGTMYPSDDDIIQLINTNKWAQEYRKLITTEFSFPWTILTIALHLIEINVRETCLKFISPVKVHDLPLTEQIKLIEDWNIHTFDMVTILINSMVQIGRNDIAQKLTTIHDRMNARAENIRNTQTATDIVKSLLQMQNTFPDMLFSHLDELQKIIDKVRSYQDRRPLSSQQSNQAA